MSARAAGVDVAEARKGLDLVVLDGGRRIVESRGSLTAEAVASIVRELQVDVVCIDAPPAWSQDPRGTRACERALRAFGVSSFSTPADPGDHPFYRWMRAGHAVFDALAPTHPRYRGGPVPGRAAEVFPEATAALLAGGLRPVGQSKVRFRRGVLAAHGVEERALPNIDRVDAALAALTGVIALEGAGCAVGDPDEGMLLLPVPAVPEVRLRRAPAPAGRDGAPARRAGAPVEPRRD